MYLTAHRVRRSSPPDEGINALLHVHGTAMLARDPMGKIDIQMVAEQTPGDVKASDCDVAPGGNHILSYLDVAFEDELDPPELLVEALQRFERAIRDSDFNPRPVSMILGANVSLRFANYNRGNALDIDEFCALRERVLALYQGNLDDVAQVRLEPLIAEVSLIDDQYQIRLDAESKTRVRNVHRGRFLASGFLMEQATWDDFVQDYGREELMNIVVTSITGMSPEEVLTFAGGVSFSFGGTEVMRWPTDDARLHRRG